MDNNNTTGRPTKKKRGYRCFVKLCRIKPDGKVSFFRFPKNPERCQKWLKLCSQEELIKKIEDRDNAYFHRNFRICGKHFETKMFLNDLQNRLQPHAEPTLFEQDEFTQPVETDFYSPHDLYVGHGPTNSGFPEVKVEIHEEEDIKCSIDQLFQDGKILESNNLPGKCFPEIKLEIDEEEDTQCSIDQLFQDEKIIQSDDLPIKCSSEIKMEEVEEEDIKCSINSFIEDEKIPQSDNLPGKCILCGIKIEVDEDKSAEYDNINLDVFKKVLKCDQCVHHSSVDSNLQYHVDLDLKHKENMLDQSNKAANGQFEVVNFECDFCDYSTLRKSDLNTHYKRAHHKDKNFHCAFCSFSALHKYYLQRHIKGVHFKEKNFHCDLCNYSAQQKGSLANHIRGVHHKEKNFQCSLCNFSALHKSYLDRHIKAVHLKEKNFHCEMCNYSAQQKASLGAHIRRIHLK